MPYYAFSNHPGSFRSLSGILLRAVVGADSRLEALADTPQRDERKGLQAQARAQHGLPAAAAPPFHRVVHNPVGKYQGMRYSCSFS